MARIRRHLAATTVLVIVLAACGGDDTAPEGSTTTVTEAAVTPTTAPSASTTTTAPPESTTTTIPAVETPGVFVGAYTFAPGAVDTGFNRQPSQVSGVIGIPEGPGPFPVAVYLHGLAYDCTGYAQLDPALYVTTEWTPPCTIDGSLYIRNEYSGTAIVEQLARNGVVAISVDVNAGYFWWGGEASEDVVIDPLIPVHLGILEDIAAGALQLDGHDSTFELDMESYALIGHSRGGAFVESRLSPAAQRTPFTSPEPDVAVLIGAAGAPYDAELAVPLLNLRAECDADVGPDAGLATTQQVADLGSDLVLDGEVLGSSHWGMTSYSFGAANVGCEGIDPATTETHVAQLVGAFVSGVFANDLTLPADDTVIRLQALAGTVPPIVEPFPPSGLRPQDVPTTAFDEERLPPISPDDPFAGETSGDDI